MTTATHFLIIRTAAINIICQARRHLPHLWPALELKVHEEDKGLAIFSRVGRDDPTGFAAVEKIIPDIGESAGAGKCRYRHV